MYSDESIEDGSDWTTNAWKTNTEVKICYKKHISKHKGNSIPRHPNRGKTEEEGEVHQHISPRI